MSSAGCCESCAPRGALGVPGRGTSGEVRTLPSGRNPKQSVKGRVLSLLGKQAGGENVKCVLQRVGLETWLCHLPTM